MAKPTLSSDKSIRHKVWQPQGYNGIEICTKSSDSELYFPKFFLQNYTVVLNGQGRGSARYGSERYNFTNIKDLVFLQQPGNVFTGRFEGENGTGGACLVLPPKVLEEMARELDFESPGCPSFFQKMTLPEKLNMLTARLVTKSIETFTKPTSRLERESSLLTLVNLLLKHATDTRHADRALGNEHQAVSTVKEVIRASPGKDHSINDLARITNLNPKYLIDVFTRDVGVSPHLYLTSVRIEHAKALLVKDKPIVEVSHRLGFYDQSHFSNTFKRYVKVSPGAFRTYSRQKT